MIANGECEYVRHLVPKRAAPVEVTGCATGGAIHRDEVSKRYAEQADARQAGGAHREVVVIGIELDAYGFAWLESVALRERCDAVADQVLHVRPQGVGLLGIESCGDVGCRRSR